MLRSAPPHPVYRVDTSRTLFTRTHLGSRLSVRPLSSRDSRFYLDRFSSAPHRDVAFTRCLAPWFRICVQPLAPRCIYSMLTISDELSSAHTLCSINTYKSTKQTSKDLRKKYRRCSSFSPSFFGLASSWALSPPHSSLSVTPRLVVATLQYVSPLP